MQGRPSSRRCGFWVWNPALQSTVMAEELGNYVACCFFPHTFQPPACAAHWTQLMRGQRKRESASWGSLRRFASQGTEQDGEGKRTRRNKEFLAVCLLTGFGSQETSIQQQPICQLAGLTQSSIGVWIRYGGTKACSPAAPIFLSMITGTRGGKHCATSWSWIYAYVGTFPLSNHLPGIEVLRSQTQVDLTLSSDIYNLHDNGQIP